MTTPSVNLNKKTYLHSNALALAIQEIQGTVKQDAYNEFHKYGYASADAVYLHCRDVLSRHGITIHQSEVMVDFDPKEKIPWIKVRYEFTIRIDGKKFGESEFVTSFDKLTKPQTMAAVRTNARKYYLRSLFLLATGDPDSDESGETLQAEAAVSNGRRRMQPALPPETPEPDVRVAGQPAAWRVHDVSSDSTCRVRIGEVNGTWDSEKSRMNSLYRASRDFIAAQQEDKRPAFIRAFAEALPAHVEDAEHVRRMISHIQDKLGLIPESNES